jgi:hypothetical protein
LDDHTGKVLISSKFKNPLQNNNASADMNKNDLKTGLREEEMRTGQSLNMDGKDLEWN